EMAKYKVPGVSIAVVDRGRIVWSCGRGVLQAGGEETVAAHTLFHAASIIQVVAATMTLRLADAGKLDLDTDVNRYLRAWKVPAGGGTLGAVSGHTPRTGVPRVFLLSAC